MQVQQDIHNQASAAQPSLQMPQPASDQAFKSLIPVVTDQHHTKDEQHSKEPITQQNLYQQLSPEEHQELCYILKKNNLPLENPKLRLDIIPNQTLQQQHIAASFGATGTTISAEATDYTLSLQDVRTTFEVFGKLKDVYVVESEPMYAIIIFESFIDAYICQQSLNNFVLRRNNVTLLVKWVPQTNEQPELKLEQEEDRVSQSLLPSATHQDSVKTQALSNGNQISQQQQAFKTDSTGSVPPSFPAGQSGPFPSTLQTIFEAENVFKGSNLTSTNKQSVGQNQPFYPNNTCQPAQVAIQKQQESMSLYYQEQSNSNQAGSLQQQNNNNNSGQMSGNQCDELEAVKYTCRFEIQIENDKEFQVARRLIGSKGCNMKRIIESCSKNLPPGMQNDVVKLRLRGKGSQFKEGPKQEESKESLHLCISSRFFDKYQLACSMYQELLLNVYEEYKKFFERQKRDLRIIDEKGNLVPGGVLQIKKSEFVTGRRAQVQPLPNMFQANPQGAPTVPTAPANGTTIPSSVEQIHNGGKESAMNTHSANKLQHSNSNYLQKQSGYGGVTSAATSSHINTGSIPFHPGQQ